MIPFEWLTLECGWKPYFCFWRLLPQHWAFGLMWPASAVKPFSNASSPALWRTILASTSEFPLLFKIHQNYASYWFHAAARISLLQIRCLHSKILEGNHPGLCRYLPLHKWWEDIVNCEIRKILYVVILSLSWAFDWKRLTIGISQSEKIENANRPNPFAPRHEPAQQEVPDRAAQYIQVVKRGKEGIGGTERKEG